MIKYIKGNILESQAEAVINTVNTKGVMGKGIALQFKKSYPDMFTNYEHACKSGEVIIGKMHIWQNSTMFGPKYIINFPTKNDWKYPSKLEYIKLGLVDLAKMIKEYGIKSVAIPPLGCGNGGLDWNVVKPLVVEALKEFEELSFELFEPSGTPEKLIKPKAKTKHMTLTRALLLKLIKRYCILGYELTLLEVQKLAFFLQEFGEPMKLRYAKHIYGPYADNLRHVLIDFEGIYTQGFIDGSKNNPSCVIKILPNAITESEEYLDTHKESISDSLQRLAKVESLIEGYETPFGMELLSTVYWLIKNENKNPKNIEEIVQSVQSWNPRKARIMKPAFINKAVSRITEFV